MDKKIIFLDLDGTLTNDEKKVTPLTQKALLEMQKAGHIVVLASGRPTPGILPVAKAVELEKFGGYIMAFNGGKIINAKTNEVVFEQVLDRKYISPLLKYAKENDIGLITYDDKRIIVGTRMDKYIETESFINKIPVYETDMEEYVTYNPNKLLMTAPPEIATKHEQILAGKYKNQLSISRSADYFIEIMPKGIDKAASIEVLINKLKIRKENTIACGDGYNDISMVKYAGIGVAMENAVDEVKQVADYVTDSNNEDGIAKVVEKFVFYIINLSLL